jgi:hypothetical protein
MVRASADAGQLPELTAAQETIERLNVRPESMIVRDEHLSLRAIRRAENPLDAARRER